MNPFMLLINEIIYRPIFNLLLIFLTIFNLNLWIAIIALTLLVRLILLKPAIAWTQMQKQMTDLQPKLKEIQEKHKDDQQKLAEETMKVFKKHWSWPLKWCFMLLIQIPVFIWLFFVIRNFAQTEWVINTTEVYSFLSFLWFKWMEISQINTVFLWIDLLTWWSIVLAILAGVLIFMQMQLTMLNRPATPSIPWWENMPMPDMNQIMKFMNIFLVVIMVGFVYSMPSGIGLYIITTTFFSVMQFSIQYRELLKVKLKAYLNK